MKHHLYYCHLLIQTVRHQMLNSLHLTIHLANYRSGIQSQGLCLQSTCLYHHCILSLQWSFIPSSYSTPWTKPSHELDKLFPSLGFTEFSLLKKDRGKFQDLNHTSKLCYSMPLSIFKIYMTIIFSLSPNQINTCV